MITTLVIFGVLGAGVFFAISGWEWLHTHGRPVEHATVVSVVESGGSSYCGKSRLRPRVRLTWHSADPPPGLPATFTQDTACNPSSQGESDDVVRVPHGGGAATVYVDPATSLAEVGALTLVGFGGGVGVAGVIALFWRGWHRLRPPRHSA